MAVAKIEKVERKKEGKEEECKHAQNDLTNFNEIWHGRSKLIM
jgi:uncharacterized membrane protein